jgi:phage regulator Rha-like protein
MSNEIQLRLSQDGVTVLADSREVAANYEKRHDHVLRTIEELVSKASPNLGTPLVPPAKCSTWLPSRRTT